MRLFFNLLGLFLLLATMPAHAQTEDLVQIRLMPEHAKVQAGDEIWIGIEQSIAPHWHTYWKNPGDSGTPFRIDWDLPENFEISDINWPVPQKIPYGPLLNYGYENNVVLLQKLKIPSEIPDQPITLSADIEVLVCKEECIPEYGTYTLTLNGPESQNENNEAYIQQALKKLPLNQSTDVSFHEKAGNFILHIEKIGKDLESIDLETITFLPIDWGLVENPANAVAEIENEKLIITQPRGDRPMDKLQQIAGVIHYQSPTGKIQAFEFTAKPHATYSGMPATTLIEDKAPSNEETNITLAEISITKTILFALLGGMILNLMPCVFPVLSIKALSLVKIADKHPNLARMHGLAYTAGVIISFLIIASVLLILKSAGAQIGWGFQLQSPLIVGILACLLFVIGLSLMSFFEFGKNISIGQKLTQGQNLNSSFFTGVLATIVATPCTAPFMAGAIGFALTQTAFVNLSIFAALGLGLALPYLALSVIPALQKFMPKPGAWMETFKQLLAFPMFLSAIWLVWVISKQAGPSGVLQILLAMAAITFGIWLLNHKPVSKIWRIMTSTLAAISILSAGFLLFLTTHTPSTTTTTNAQSEENIKEFSQEYSHQKLQDLLEEDHPIFVEMTAAWCITCKVNQAVAINKETTKTAFSDNNVQYLIGDWTNQDPEITKYLNLYGRNGVPIYVYYGPRDAATGKRPEAKILPQILTPGMITGLFKKET